mmetsp:Transcript_16568/g.20839  ORF Transcript_16568/g.20839 Transcript_16568/m.20839 type:complete len:267 (+) Transcript_16568:301-1101(+)
MESPIPMQLDRAPCTVIGKNAKLKGHIEGPDLMEVHGSFEGSLTSQGDVVIRKDAQVKADMDKVGKVKVEGNLNGNIKAKHISVSKLAKVRGSVLSMLEPDDHEVEGEFNGNLFSEGENWRITPTGVLNGSVRNMERFVVEGKVFGDISVENLELLNKAVVFGNIRCHSMFVHQTAIICGKVKDHPEVEINFNGPVSKIQAGVRGRLARKRVREMLQEKVEMTSNAMLAVNTFLSDSLKTPLSKVNPEEEKHEEESENSTMDPNFK